MKRFGLNSGYIGVDRRQTEAGIAPLQKAYLERVRDGGYFPGVILLQAYPGAAAAYSLRRLSNTYNGNAIRVRRASDNTEQNIGFNSAGNLDTLSLTAFCIGTNGFVTTWYDQSGNGSNATQVSSTSQPQIINAGNLITLNGKPSILFDGTNDDLRIPIVGTPVTDFYFVLNTSDTAYIYPVAGPTIYGFVGVLGDGTLNLHQNYGTPSLYVNGTLKTPANRGQVYTDTNGYKLIVHQNSNTNAWTGGFGLFAYGGGFNFNGNAQEIIIYPSNQSLNRPGIESNINSYYNIY